MADSKEILLVDLGIVRFMDTLDIRLIIDNYCRIVEIVEKV
jgi:hypothetical protein